MRVKGGPFDGWQPDAEALLFRQTCDECGRGDLRWAPAAMMLAAVVETMGDQAAHDFHTLVERSGGDAYSSAWCCRCGNLGVFGPWMLDERRTAGRTSERASGAEAAGSARRRRAAGTTAGAHPQRRRTA